MKTFVLFLIFAFLLVLEVSAKPADVNMEVAEIEGASSAEAKTNERQITKKSLQFDESNLESEEDPYDEDDDMVDFASISSVPGPLGPMFQQIKESLQQLQEQVKTIVTQTMANTTSLLELPDNYNNSTSQTKVINGNLVTVNETVQKTNDNGVQSVYHIKVVSLKSDNQTATATATATKSQQQMLPQVSNNTTEEIPTKVPESKVTLNATSV